MSWIFRWLHTAWDGQKQLRPYIFILILSHHPNYGDMLIGHLLPGVKFIFLSLSASLAGSLSFCSSLLSAALTGPSCLWGGISSLSKHAPSPAQNMHTYMHGNYKQRPLVCTHFMCVNLCVWQDAHTQMQHIEVVAIFVSYKWLKASAGAVRQAVKPSQLRKHEIFRQ